MTEPVAVDEEVGKVRPYKVLVREDVHDDVLLREIGTYSAGDHRGAIRQAVKAHGFAQYVAVAESSWHDEAPKPDPEPRILWGATA